MSVHSKMTAIADAIRAKTGKTGVLTLDAMAEEINNLKVEEIIRHAQIPAYVKSEALRVANLVESVREDDSIVFIAMSDNHHYGSQSTADQYPDANGIQTNTSNLHAAMAAKILAYALNVDFMAHLGDVTWGHQKTSSTLLHEQGEEFINMLHEAHGDVPCFHAIGNHDTGIYYHNAQKDAGLTGIFTESGSYLFDKYTSLSESPNTLFGTGTSNGGGYCYRDFEAKKLRVFLLNTSEALVVNQSDAGTLASQRQWFADGLINLNNKTDAEDWQFIVLSHYPADYGNTMPLSDLLKAYVKGTSITISGDGTTSTAYNFSGKNKAKIIAQFHGHVHNFLISKLHDSSQAKYDAWRMCIPNGQYNRENYYTTAGSYTNINFSQSTSYPKTANSAEETTFVVGVIDPAEKVVRSFTYGAGPEESVLSYGETIYHSITSSLTNATISNTAANVENGQPYSATIVLNDHCAINNINITMSGADITSQVYSNNTISIPSVTGPVIITVKAAIALACTNWIPISTTSSGSIYNGVGYKNNVYIQNGNDSSNGGTMATGFIPIKNGDIIRFKNMSFTRGQANHRIVFYNSSYGFIGQMAGNGTYLMDTTLKGVQDSNSNYVQFTITTGHAQSSGASYIRICCANITTNSIVSVNEEIKYADEISAFTVTNTLSNVTTSNTVNNIAKNAKYTATLTPNVNCSMSSVKVTMGGVDITSSAYNSSTRVISIASVTGNVIITATATKNVSYTNQIPISTDTDGSIFNGTGFITGKRLNSSGGVESLSGGHVSGFIPVKKNDIVYMQNVTYSTATVNGVTNGNQRILYYDANKNAIAYATSVSTAIQNRIFDGDILVQFTVQDWAGGDMTNVAYFRICAAYIGGDSIITVNQPIE